MNAIDKSQGQVIAFTGAWPGAEATPPAVTITGFWRQVRELNRTVTIPHIYEQLRQRGVMDAFRLDWTPGAPNQPQMAADTDLYKWIEAASGTLAAHPDEQLRATLAEIAGLIASAQQPDGYLNTYYTVVDPGGRWANLRDGHELYAAGHFLEAAVRHWQATGSRTLLDAAIRFADHIDRHFGPAPHQSKGYCGHPVIELGLVKLFRATGERRYLALAHHFLRVRGTDPYYFDLETASRPHSGFGDVFGAFKLSSREEREYNQTHAPVAEQSEARGHAVRAGYLFAAATAVAAEAGDTELGEAALRVWHDLVGSKLYITGGAGSSRRNEGFTEAFDLPNRTAYAETCASIALVMWAHELGRAHRDARYADVLELALYNGVLGGLGLGRV